MRKLAGSVRMNFSRTLEIHQRLAAILGAFTQEKQPSLSKISKLHGTFAYSAPLPLPAALQRATAPSAHRQRAPVATSVGTMGMNPAPASLQESSTIAVGPQCGFLKDTTWMAAFIFTCLVHKPFPRGICQQHLEAIVLPS